MRLWVLSDLHIQSSSDPLYSKLISLIRNRVQSHDTLVLAGDIFDLFVGNKPLFLDRFRELIEVLREAGARDVEMHYIEGNHDFQIGGSFGKIPGLTVHTKGVELERGGRRFWIAHGDLVDRADYGYRFLRGFFRSLPMQAFLASAPGEWIDWIGNTSSRASRGAKPLLVADLPEERRDRLRRVYRSYAADRISRGYDYVILGHCHDLDAMSFKVGDRNGQYVNMGFPPIHGTFLLWELGDAEIRREPI